MRYFCLRCDRPVDRGALERHKGLQIIDSSNVAGREHIEFALKEAESAFEEGVNLSRNPLVEVVVRVSAQKQISKALELFGLKDSREIIAIGDKLPDGFVEEFKCKEMDLKMDTARYERVKKAFGIDDVEILSLADKGFESRAKILMGLVKERIALIQVL